MGMSRMRVLHGLVPVALVAATTLTQARAAGSKVHVFDRGDSRANASTGDWSNGNFKAECDLGEEAVGLSVATSGTTTHALECGAGSGVAASARTGCHNVVFSRSDARGTTATGDWDSGYYKGECAANEYVAGVSQSTQGQMQSILCCSAPSATHASCSAAKAMGEGDARESGSTSGDWDYGYYKGECGSGRYIAGVSRAVANGRPHKILCCSGAAQPAPPAQPQGKAWDGKPLTDGAKIALQVGVHENLMSSGYGSGVTAPFGPLYVGITSFQFPRTSTGYNYLNASRATLGDAAIFTVTLVPNIAAAANCGTSNLQSLILKAPDGTYVKVTGDGGFLITGASQGDADVLQLDMSHGTSASFTRPGYTYSQRSNSYAAGQACYSTGWFWYDPSQHQGDTGVPSTLTLMMVRQGYSSQSSYASITVISP